MTTTMDEYIRAYQWCGEQRPWQALSCRSPVAQTWAHRVEGQCQSVYKAQSGWVAARRPRGLLVSGCPCLRCPNTTRQVSHLPIKRSILILTLHRIKVHTNCRCLWPPYSMACIPMSHMVRDDTWRHTRRVERRLVNHTTVNEPAKSINQSMMILMV